MYDVDVHPAVYAELEYSRAWYEERAESLGTEFLVHRRTVQVIAVAHLRRHPDYWRDRIWHWNGDAIT
jgi:hypothetical protein